MRIIKIRIWIKWQIARFLDWYLPNACWADLCSWALEYTDELKTKSDCHINVPKVGCWCGKNLDKAP